MYRVKYLGRRQGFPQRHFTYVSNLYCSQIVKDRAKGLRRSPVTLDLIRDDVLRNVTSTFRPEDEVFKQVVRDAAKAWRLPQQVQPIHLNDLPKMTFNTDDSSPGLPWKLYGYNKKREILDDPEAFTSVRRFWHQVKYSDCPVHAPDCAAYLRAHLVPEDEEKVRAVWGYPATVTFGEACFAIPLINAYKTANSPIAYGYETARGGHLRIRNRFGDKGNFLSLDFKNFDKTIPAWLIEIAFNILLINIDFSAYQTTGTPRPYNLKRAWDFIVDYFINTPIRLANGERYKKSSGVASGSYFTQLIDSVVNWIVVEYAMRCMNNKVIDILVLGDDSLVKTVNPVNIAHLGIYAARCGMIVNYKKSSTSTRLYEVKFLGYEIRNGEPFKPEIEFWAALRYPEQPDRSFDEYATRAMGLLLASFGQHADFYRAVYQITKRGYTPILKPSQRRYMNALGISHLPLTPPKIHELMFPAYESRKSVIFSA